MWRGTPFAALILTACGSSGGDCDAGCEAVIHFVGNVGLPADIDQFTFSMCTDECIDVQVTVPRTTATQSAGSDPSVRVTVTRTNEDFHQDLQGVFAFDATWSSKTERLRPDDLVSVRIVRADGGNIASTLRDLDAEETAGSCGCPTIETGI